MTIENDGNATDHESPTIPINRRRVLKSAGGAVVGTALYSGTGSAHIDEGKGISWIAFCGCDDSFTIRYIRCTEEGELGAVAYDCDGGTVYYKAGRSIYEHRYTRRNEDNDPDNDTDGYRVIEIDYAGNEDPEVSSNPSDSRDPCGILNGSGGTKLEEAEIREEANVNNCSPVDGPTGRGRHGNR